MFHVLEWLHVMAAMVWFGGLMSQVVYLALPILQRHDGDYWQKNLSVNRGLHKWAIGPAMIILLAAGIGMLAVGRMEMMSWVSHAVGMFVVLLALGGLNQWWASRWLTLGPTGEAKPPQFALWLSSLIAQLVILAWAVYTMVVYA